ncbi:MAG: DinB family protein [Bacteroidota bacterium]
MNKDTAVQKLAESFEAVAELVRSCSAEGLNHCEEEGKWPIIDHLRHLILSAKPVASSLKLSEEDILKICQPSSPSRSYDSLEGLYQTLMREKGSNTTPNFYPEHLQEYTVEELLSSWSMIRGKMVSRLGEWSEERLERNGLPHPRMGVFTMREMVYFTTFHNWHHEKIMSRIQALT